MIGASGHHREWNRDLILPTRQPAPWQRAALREYQRLVKQAFRVPFRLVIGPVPAKAPHKRRYQRRHR